MLSTIAIQYLLKARLVRPEQLGLNKTRRRTIAVIALTTAVGLTLFALQNPRTTEPIVVFNVFMQALPLSIAEVVVCWGFNRLKF